MNAFTIAVRTQDANARILNAAKQLAPRHWAQNQLVALESVSDKDPQAENVKRLEAVAALLEQIANSPANTPAPTMSTDMPHVVTPLSVATPDNDKTTPRKGGKR